MREGEGDSLIPGPRLKNLERVMGPGNEAREGGACLLLTAELQGISEWV